MFHSAGHILNWYGSVQNELQLDAGLSVFIFLVCFYLFLSVAGMVLSRMNCSLMVVLAHFPVITNHYIAVHCILKIAQNRLHNVFFGMHG